MAASDSSGHRVEPADYKPGDTIGTDDFIFRKIGEPLPLKSSGSDFDLRSAPVQALAVSDRFRLLFLAHSEGFYVLRTKDAIEAAKRAKDVGKLGSVEEVSLLDVSIGRVSILLLSADSSFLAVCVAGTVHLFSIASLLNKDREPSFSCSLPDSGLVKDMKWRNGMQTSFVVLSTSGKLYLGEKGAHLKDVMDHVDAVDWSLNGDYIVVAKNNILRLLSSDLVELFSISLSFESVMDITDAYSVKVDLIKWVRDDSIIIGCLQINEDEIEEGYVTMVIQTKKKGIVEDPSRAVVLSFTELFAAVVDDMLPCGCGPYMFISYIEQWQVALAANRKNTDQHIVSLQWSMADNQSDAVAVDFGQDKDIPRIELTESGDDNLILGFGVDKVSIYEKIEVKKNDAEQQELSPFCILLSLSSDGKLIMFYVARFSEPKISAHQHLSDFVGKIQDSSVISVGEYISDLSTESSIGDTGQSQLPQNIRENLSLITDSYDSEIPLSQPLITMADSSFKQRGSMTFTKQGTQTQHTEQSKVVAYGSEVASSSVDPASTSKQTVAGEKQHSTEVGKVPMEPDVSSSTAYGMRSGSQSFGSLLLSKDSNEKDSTISPVQASLQLSSKNSLQSETEVKMSGIIGSNFPVNKYNQSFGNASSANKSVLTGPSTSGSSAATTSLESTKSSVLKNVAGKAFSSPVSTGSTSNFSLFGSSSSLQNNGDGNIKYGASPAMGDVASQSFQTGNKMSIMKEKYANLASSSSSARAHVVEHKALSLGTNVSAPSYNVYSSNTGKISNSKGSVRPMHYNLNRYNGPELTKNFCNVNEILKEMDTLLSHIAEEGGFRDACTFHQESSILELEEGLEKLSERCRKWKSKSDQHQRDIQQLQAKTVQVLTRKIYIEGFIKQAFDKHYWEYWDLQKLKPEFELKKLHLEKLHQNLMSQLINLERHFNAIELNKYGESSTNVMSQNMSARKLDSKRSVPSLHSLYNTLNSQLAVAEQLSECLSKQMAILNIRFPPKKQTNVTKELFASIGLPYYGDETYNSPDVKKIANKLDSVKGFSPSLRSNKERPMKNALTALKEPETARRRRDSLDKSWTSFEPKKTIVKRMLREGKPKVRLDKSSFEMTQEIIDSENADGSTIFSSKEQDQTSLSLTVTKDKNDIMFGKKETEQLISQISKSTSGNYFKWAKEPLEPFQSGGSPFSIGQPFGSRVQTPSTYVAEVSSAKQSLSGDSNSFTGQPAAFSEQKQIMFPKSFGESIMSIIPDISQKEIDPPKQALNKQAQVSEVPIIKSGESVLASTFTDVSGPSSGHFQLNTSSKISVSGGTYGRHSMSATIATSGIPFPSLSINDVSPLSSSPSLQDSKLVNESNALFSPIIPFSSSMSTTSSLTSSKSHQLSSFFSPASSSSSLANPSTSSLITASTAITSDSLVTSVSATMSSVSTNIPSTTAPTSPFSLSGNFHIQANKLESTSIELSSQERQSVVSSPSITADNTVCPELEATASVPSEIVASTSLSESQPALNKDGSGFSSFTAMPNVFVASNSLLSSKPESTIPVSYSAAVSDGNADGSQSSSVSSFSFERPPLFMSPAPILANSTETVNDVSDVAISQEDEMEEEVPDISTELGLSALGGFGLGSATSMNAPSSNPFGVPFSVTNANPINSQVSLAVSTGELFQPPSFSLPSPSPSQPSQSSSQGAFSSAFGVNNATSTGFSGFGQPAQIGGGQQVLGSVLGTFGQSRQLGSGLPGSGFGSSSGFGGGGFSSVSAGGGFASVASGGGGFAALASGGGGFAAAASSGGGFAAAASSGGGFSAAASAPSAGGFAAFGGRQSGGGFSAFGSSNSTPAAIPDRFTQMRK